MRIFFQLSWVLLFVFSCSTKKQETSTVQNNTDSLSFTYYKKARVFEQNNINDSAYYYLQLAHKNALLLKDSSLLSKIIFNKAVIDYKNHDLPISETHCIKALEYLADDSDTYKRYIFNLLGLIAKEKKDYVTAIEYYEKARSFYKNQPDTLSSYIAYQNNISNIYKEDKNYELAIQHLNQIMRIEDLAEKFPKKFARALDNKAKLLLSTGQPKQAKRLLDSAYQIRKNVNDNLGLIQSHLSFSDYYYETGNRDLALQHATMALKIAKENEIPKNQSDSYNRLIRLHLGKNSPVFDEYLSLNDSILFEQQKAKEQTARIRFESAEKERKINRQQQIIIQNELEKQKLITGLLLLGMIALAIGIILISYFRKYKRNKSEIDKLIKEVHRIQEKLSQKSTASVEGTATCNIKQFHKFLMEKYEIERFELIDVWQNIAMGVSRKDYAEKINISENTVKSWIKKLYAILKEHDHVNNADHSRFTDAKAVKEYYENLLDYNFSNQC